MLAVSEAAFLKVGKCIASPAKIAKDEFLLTARIYPDEDGAFELEGERNVLWEAADFAEEESEGIVFANPQLHDGRLLVPIAVDAPPDVEHTTAPYWVRFLRLKDHQQQRKQPLVQNVDDRDHFHAGGG
jgi:hypothetical protein